MGNWFSVSRLSNGFSVMGTMDIDDTCVQLALSSRSSQLHLNGQNALASLVLDRLAVDWSATSQTINWPSVVLDGGVHFVVGRTRAAAAPRPVVDELPAALARLATGGRLRGVQLAPRPGPNWALGSGAMLISPLDGSQLEGVIFSSSLLARASAGSSRRPCWRLCLYLYDLMNLVGLLRLFASACSLILSVIFGRTRSRPILFRDNREESGARSGANWPRETLKRRRGRA